jgi:hypothetical protein
VSNRHLASALFGLSCLLLLLAAPARAGTVCVKDVAGLKSALASFEHLPNGSTLTVKLARGTYAVGDQLAYMYGSNADGEVGLKLLGGYSSDCSSRTLDPANTVLDGLDAPASGFGFLLRGEANALIEGISFTRFVGKSTIYWSEDEVLLLSSTTSGSDSQVFEVRQCRFTHNKGQNIVRLSGAQMRFVNNLVVDSTLAQAENGGIDLGAFTVTLDADVDGMVTATNNTITGTRGGPAMRIGTLITGDSERISEVTDNILWNNQNLDILFTGTTEHVYPLLASFNLYASSNSNFPQSPTDLHVDPRFVDAANGNFRLASNSPAINKGAFVQLMGFPARDLDGNPRIVGSRIDIGAYESAIDDTTTAVVTTTSDNGSNAAPTPGSLRAAIKAGNAAGGPFRIVFDVPGGCPRLLSLAAPMLDVTGDVTIDGTTQPGWTPNDRYGAFDANLCFFVNGAGNANTPWALHVPSTAPAAARLVVRGLGFAGFTDAAIKLEGGRNHRIAGNLFGAIPFTPQNANAIRVTGQSGGAFVGGYDDPAALNLIAVSSAAGIYLDNASGGSTVANNVIGFQADGVGNGGNASGVLVFNSPNNVIQYNYVGNSASSAITLSGAASSGNLVQYNTIGENADGDAAPNGSGGVLINFAAGNNTIGAPLNATWGGNFIVNGTGPGVWISPSGGSGNRVLDNVFYGNTGLDVDLAQAGPSANQATNPASGPNGLQNYPVLASAERDAATDTETVTGTLSSAANTTYRLDLYWGPDCPASGRGSARFPLTKTYVTTGALGAVPFTATVPFGWGPLPAGAISGTATDPAGNTSEIGNCVAETISDRIFQNGFD